MNTFRTLGGYRRKKNPLFQPILGMPFFYTKRPRGFSEVGFSKSVRKKSRREKTDRTNLACPIFKCLKAIICYKISQNKALSVKNWGIYRSDFPSKASIIEIFRILQDGLFRLNQ